MEKFKSLFSHSFSEQALEQIYGILDKVRLQCADEFYIILNDFKHALSMNEEGDGDIVYTNNNTRLSIIQSIDKQQILKDINNSSNEYKILSEILNLTGMFERIENHLLDNSDSYKPLFNMFGKSDNGNDSNLVSLSLKGGARNEYQPFSISYNEKSEIILQIGSRDLTLIVVLLVIYLFFDSNDYVFNLYNHINFHYHHGITGKLEASDVYDNIANNPNMRNETINSGMSVNEILNISFNKFHNLIHIMNSNYNINSLTVQFCIIQVWIMFKSLILLNKYNGTNEYIDIKNITANKELDCSVIHDGIEPAFSLALLCSIYSFNSKYGWFDINRFNAFVNAYGQTVKTLSVFITDREKYNTLYALGSIYALRYTNISLSNKMFEHQITKQIDDLTTEWLTNSNKAMLFTVKSPKADRKLNYFVLEVQDRVLYISNTINTQNESTDSFSINNQVMNDNRNYLNSFIVYSVLKPEKNNIDYICYDIDDLKTVLTDYKNGLRNPIMKRTNNYNVDIDESIKLMTDEINYNGLILKMIGFVMIIAVIVFITFTNSHAKELKYRQTKYDKSLY